MCAMWASSDVRCHFMEHFFLGSSCFGSGGAGLASLRRSASASVPELSLSRHAAWLNFADLRFSGDFFAYRILLFTIVCYIAVLLVLVVAVSCLAFCGFWRFFIKCPAGQCLMMYDNRYWYIYIWLRNNTIINGQCLSRKSYNSKRSIHKTRRWSKFLFTAEKVSPKKYKCWRVNNSMLNYLKSILMAKICPWNLSDPDKELVSLPCSNTFLPKKSL